MNWRKISKDINTEEEEEEEGDKGNNKIYFKFKLNNMVSLQNKLKNSVQTLNADCFDSDHHQH